MKKESDVMQRQESITAYIEKPSSQSGRRDEFPAPTARSPSAAGGTCRSTSGGATRRSIHWSKKLHVAARQNFRCATVDRSTCPRWLLDNGVFGAEAFEIDHIRPHAACGSDELDNLRALCHACHAIRTRLQRIATCGKEDTFSDCPLARTKSEDGGRSTE